MKNYLLSILVVMLVGCESTPQSKSSTAIAAKEIRQEFQKKKTSSRLKKTTLKNADIISAEKARDQDSSNPEKWYNLGMAYWLAYQKTENQFSHDQALDAFKTVLKMVPGNVVTIKAIYNVYYRDLIVGKIAAYSSAKEYFDLLTPEHQKSLNPPSLAKYIYLYYDQQKQKKTDYHNLHNTLLQAIQEQPFSDASYIQLAKLYSNQSYYPLAVATLKLGAEQNPQSMDLLKSIASTYEARASADGCHYENGQWINQASRFYLKAVRVQPDSADLHLGLARLFMDRDMPQLSAYETDLLLELQPSARNYAFAAHNFALMGNKDRANRLLESAKTAGLVASDPAYHEVYMISGDWLKAALSFTDYIQAQKRLHVYDAIKADIISQQSGVKLLSLISKKQIVYASDWQTLIYAWWQGSISEDKLKSVVTNKCERAEFNFYSGYKAMLAGDPDKAQEAFHQTIEQNTYRFIERPLAKGFLANIK
jgi:hypothetical protein